MINQTTKTIACLLAGLALSACMEKEANLTTADYPNHPNRYFQEGTGEVLGGQCFTQGCFAYYPSNIDIAPLTDTSGRATYSGTIQGAYLISNTQYDTYAQEASFQVDFGARTVRYQGVITGISTNVSATYNSRGVMTGSYRVGSRPGRIIGLVGETELLGSFALDNGDSAGGFRGLRQ